MPDLDVHLTAIRQHDANAFARWVAGAESVVRNSLRSFSVSIDTEAVVQETLLRMWQVAPRFVPDGKPNGLVRLALRIARNLAISEQRRHPATSDRAGSRDSEQALVDTQTMTPAPIDPMLRRVIATCRELLPKQPALALFARLESDGTQPDEALAHQVGMRKNTFLQNVTRARRALIECLERHGVDWRAELS